MQLMMWLSKGNNGCSERGPFLCYCRTASDASLTDSVYQVVVQKDQVEMIQVRKDLKMVEVFHVSSNTRLARPLVEVWG